MADNNFYRAFEERYRGSRELIKSRLAVYLPFIRPIQKFYPNAQGVDLGCGRGEWLELMQENGMAVRGIDMDQGMLTEARELGLNVTLGDAIQSLQKLESGSQILVSGFHLAEHLPFETLQILIQESLRVLKPGGLMILETPNAENLTIGTEKFYLDPTHSRPIPSEFLLFMTEYAGFNNVKVLRLQEPNGIADSTSLHLLNVLNGVSPDYAVVAQKSGSPEMAEAVSVAFNASYGLTLEDVANSYDKQIKTSISHINAKALHVDSIARQADLKAEEAKILSQQALEVAQQADATLNIILTSSSWKLTAPLRVIGRKVKAFKFICTESIRVFLAHVRIFIMRHPRFRRIFLIVFSQFPSLKVRLAKTPLVSFVSESHNLTPRARQIYDDLNIAIEKNNKENN